MNLEERVAKLEEANEWEKKYNLLEAVTRILISSILQTTALNIVGVGERLLDPMNQCEDVMRRNRGVK